MINYQTHRVLAIYLDKNGTLTATARSKKAGAFSLTNDRKEVVKSTGPLKIVFSPSRGKSALFSFESGTWRPHYPIVETYFLNEAWPLGQGDLEYGNRNNSAMRYNHPEDADIALTVTGKEVTWNNSAVSPRKFVLDDKPELSFDTLIASLRLREGIGGSLTITQADGKEVFKHVYE